MNIPLKFVWKLNMKINCIIVDDEPSSREVVKTYINNMEALTLAAECKNAVEALEVLNDGGIQLMFLDINMPKISGVQLLKSLTKPPKVIFTTAYPNYAVEGFELDAVDYLLKPFSFERFLKGVNKYIRLSEKETSTVNQTIFLKSEKKLYRVPIKDVIYIEAIGDYVKVVFGEQNILVHSTFHDLLEQVSHSGFIRTHRSYAIAIDKIDYIDGNQIIIKGKTLPIGKTYKNELLIKLEGKY